MDDKLRLYIAEIEPKWRAFLDRLADEHHPYDAGRPGWGPQDEAWLKTRHHLDAVAAAYVAWHVDGKAVNEPGLVDDARLLELIELCVPSDADRRVFLAICQQLAREWRERRW